MSKNHQGPGAAARWTAFWMLDGIRQTGMKKMFEADVRAMKTGTSVQETQEKLQALLSHARTTTAFYKDLPADAALCDFPLVDKDSFRNHYEAHLSSAYLQEKGSRTMSTSGSTGTPLTVPQNRDKVLHDTADGVFFGAAANYFIGQKMAFIRVWVNNVRKSPLSLFAENMIMMDSSSLGGEAIFHMLEVIRKKKVQCLLGYASALAEISRYIEQTGYDTAALSVCAVIPISESLLPSVRKKLSEQFRCPVKAWYSNEENGIMGVQEADSERYYINSENYYYEILKLDKDEPAEEGELGRIVITDLRNYAMPMIRYDNGDMASFVRQEKNGRFRLFLTQIAGRRSDLLYDTQGRAVTPFVITNNLWDVPGVKQYQFIQKGKKDYELRLNGDEKAMDLADILGRIRPYLGEDAEIKTVFTDGIPVMASGKRKYIVNAYRP